jgi:tetratricopeptide (TPR) repeat protein
MQSGTMLLLLSLFFFHLNAQSSLMKSGMQAFRVGDFSGAIREFDALIQSNPNPSVKADAHFHRAESYSALLDLLRPSDVQPSSSVYSNALVRACEDYQMALALNPSAWKQRLEGKWELLFPELIREGVEMLETARKNGNPLVRAAKIEAAALRFDLAAKLRPGLYLPVDLLGQVAMAKGLYQQAEQLLNEAVRMFEAHKPPTPDLLFAYAYYRLALLHRHYLHPGALLPPSSALQQGLTFLRKARAVLETEYRRAGKMAAQIESQNLALFQLQYQQAQQDFFYLELDLLLLLPELHEEALLRFQEALRKEPRNYALLLAYAQLLERFDVEGALAVYQKAAALQSDACEAHYHIGLILFNEASRLEKEAFKTKNLEEYQGFLARSREQLLLAHPHLRTAYQCIPENLEIVRALVQVTLNLHLPADYERYRKRHDELIAR